jgi:acetyl esterase/lipase
MARDRGGPPIAFQVLLAPILDDRQQTPASRLDALPVWSRESNAFGGAPTSVISPGSTTCPPTPHRRVLPTSPACRPAFVAVGALDGFRDEDVDYALRLNQAGVPAELHLYPGAPHGFQIAPEPEVCRRSSGTSRTGWLGSSGAALHRPRDRRRHPSCRG